MARLVAEMTMSLDGFIALPDDSVDGLFDWYNNGEVEVATARPDMTWHVTEASAMHLRGPPPRWPGTRTSGWRGRTSSGRPSTPDSLRRSG
ncbi:hypothetical protein R5O87_20340 [Arthrobacter globiformis]|uniref:hypothetical protein n=1 Tax=Arthrobacter globiformis TaxID=1665 RepID=UPI00397CA88C